MIPSINQSLWWSYYCFKVALFMHYQQWPNFFLSRLSSPPPFSQINRVFKCRLFRDNPPLELDSMYTFAIGGVNKSKWLLWSSTTFFPLWQSSIICNLVPWQWITRACSIIVLSLVLKWLVALKWRPECPIIQSPPYSSRAFLRIECYSDSCLIGKHIHPTLLWEKLSKFFLSF